MQRKNTLFLILVYLIFYDIVLTCCFVIFFNAIEINPLCNNFLLFMIIKIIITIIVLYVTYKIKKTPFWSNFITLWIVVYGTTLFFNLNNIINYFF